MALKCRYTDPIFDCTSADGENCTSKHLRCECEPRKVSQLCIEPVLSIVHTPQGLLKPCNDMYAEGPDEF